MTDIFNFLLLWGFFYGLGKAVEWVVRRWRG